MMLLKTKVVKQLDNVVMVACWKGDRDATSFNLKFSNIQLKGLFLINIENINQDEIQIIWNEKQK